MNSLDQRTLKEAVDILVGAEEQGDPGTKMQDKRCGLFQLVSWLTHCETFLF